MLRISSKIKEVKVFGSKHCSLCDHVYFQLGKLADARPDLIISKVDVYSPENKIWLKYKFDIPVLHLNNVPIMKHYLDLPLLEEYLDKSPDELVSRKVF